jgi:hypothetical protein
MDGRGNDEPGTRSPDNARSGDFSRDPAFDPEQLFEVIGREDNVERVSQAMRAFLEHPDAALFERAVATFVRSARARGAPVESVLAVLIGLAEAREGNAYPHDWTLTDLRWLILRGVLLAFYGDAAVGSRTPGVERRGGLERRRSDVTPPRGASAETF